MIDVPHFLRINAKVCEILDRCESGEKTPLAMLHDCMEELEADSSWAAQEIERVRQAVIRMLSPSTRQ